MYLSVHPFPFRMPYEVLSCYFCGRVVGSLEGFRVRVGYGVALYVRLDGHGPPARVLCPTCWGKFGTWVKSTTKVYQFHSCVL